MCIETFSKTNYSRAKQIVFDVQKDNPWIGSVISASGMKVEGEKTKMGWVWWHCQRVAILTAMFGLNELSDSGKLSDRDMSIAVAGALTHDNGKWDIPRTILETTEQLTPEQWEILKRHPGYGEKRVRLINSQIGDSVVYAVQKMFGLSVARVVGGSHAFQRNPYPDGVQVTDSELQIIKLVGIADSMDAIVTNNQRPYIGNRKDLERLTYAEAYDKVREEIQYIRQ